MRIFLIEWSTPILIKVAKELKDKSTEIIYWTGGRLEKVDKNDFPTTIIHSTFAAVKAISAQTINEAEFAPVSKELLEKLFECESNVLTMMNRLDYSNVPLPRKKQIYYQYVKYWQGVLNKFKPQALVWATTPHMVYDYVLYSLAKLFKIPTIMFDVTVIPDRLMPLNDIKQGNLELKQELAKKENVKAEDLSQDLKNYYLKMIDKKNQYLSYVPIYEKTKKKKISIIKAIKSQNFLIKERDFILRLLKKNYKNLIKLFTYQSKLTTFDDNYVGWEYFKMRKKWKKIKQQFKTEYLKLQSRPDLEKKYLFFPLHYQPENSTCPMGDVFVEQLLIIDILAKAVPADWLIYIKEHPSQWYEGGTHAHQGRQPGWYQKLANYKNVRLVPTQIPAYELISKSQAVATITGTAGWEAVLKTKPVLAFGYPFYFLCEGVFPISSVEDCQQAIDKIVNGYKVNEQKVLNFFGAIDKIFTKGHYGGGYEGEVTLAEEECVRNISETVYQRLLKAGLRT